MSYELTTLQIEGVVQKAAAAIFNYCQAHSKHYLITGVSGGLDSAVSIALAQQACRLAQQEDYPLTSVGLILPCFSPPEHAALAQQAIEKFEAEAIIIPLDDACQQIETGVLAPADAQIQSLLARSGGPDFSDWDQQVAHSNIKVRLRMMCGTYHVARMLNGIVLSTDNYSEYLMGFWTLNGDVGDFGPIQKIFKGLELYDIARCLGVPQAILEARPTDGLGISDGDEAQLGADYTTVDRIMIGLLQAGFDPDGPMAQLDALPLLEDIDQALVLQLARRCLQNAYKRKGCVYVERADLGLPALRDIVL